MRGKSAGVGFLPTSTTRWGAAGRGRHGVSHHADLWLTYHKEFRNSDRTRSSSMAQRFSIPRPIPAFAMSSSIPNDLVPLMAGPRTNFGLQGYAAAGLAAGRKFD